MFAAELRQTGLAIQGGAVAGGRPARSERAKRAPDGHRHLVSAWLPTLPASMLLAGGLFVLFRALLS
jgi:hypothetical protein